MNIGILIIGILLIIESFLLPPTDNFQSTLVFKILPFFGGLFLLVYFANVIGWLTI